MTEPMSTCNLKEIPYESESQNGRVRNLLPEEQPREKLMQYGPDVLTDAELLAILLRSGSKGMNVLETSRALMKQTSGIHKLARCDWDEMRSIKGIGSVKAVTLVAAFELARRVNAHDGSEEVVFRNPEQAYSYFGPMLRDLNKEVFVLVSMNSAKRMLRYHRISTGGTNATIVDVPEIMRLAIMDRARSILLLHNHPSGNTEPSRSDISLTRQIVKSAAIMGLHVCDHVIVAGKKYTSFQARGLLR